MKIREIQIGSHKFDFVFGQRVLDRIDRWIAPGGYTRYFIIADDGIPEEIVERAVSAFAELAPTVALRFPGGEANKTLEVVSYLAEEIIRLGADRKSAIVAVGGGLTGNMAGVVAGLLYRGIALIHYPTTFLAATDSVLSIKQAVNLKAGKNLVGFFYPPRLVLVDTAVLTNSPTRHIRAGMCELVKNVLVTGNRDVVGELNADNRYTPEQIGNFIDYCISTKISVLKNDMFEKADGLIFEYGHTIGHAIELAENGRMLHGEAVAVGMLYAAKVSNRLELLSSSDRDLHFELLDRIGILGDVRLSADTEEIYRYLLHDNKRGYLNLDEGKIGMVLLDGIGAPHRYEGQLLTPVDKSLVYQILQEGTD